MIHSNVPAALKGDTLSYDIDTAAGQSGSPVYIEDGDVIKLVGIHKGYSPR